MARRTVLLVLLAMLGLTTGVVAQPQPAVAQQTDLKPDWIADSRTGCRVWNPIPQPNESIRWDGPCSNGLADGRGTLQWFQDGRPTSRYEGEFRDGKLHGRGVYTLASGDRYEGEVRDGKEHGRGVYTSAKGDRYEGEYRDGKEHGRGVYTSAAGDRYEGEWRDDKPNGFGIYSTRGGETYTGTWTNGCFRQGDRQAMLGASKEDCGF